MSASRVIRDEFDRQYWSVIRSCLHEFHKLSADTARRKTMELLRKYEKLSDDAIDIFYNSEPFSIACALAGKKLNLEPFLQRYLEIRDGDTPTTVAPTKPRKVSNGKLLAPVVKKLRRA